VIVLHQQVKYSHFPARGFFSVTLSAEEESTFAVKRLGLNFRSKFSLCEKMRPIQ
jgi:hypothetical protein